MLQTIIEFLDYYFTRWVYVRRSVTDECGLTHEGTLFGIPAWFTGDDKYTAIGVPKIVPLQYYCILADKSLDLLTYFMPDTWSMETPCTIREKRK